MSDKFWKIEYMPSFDGPGIIQWVFKGSEQELYKYLWENHRCKGNCCSLYTNFESSPIASAYLIDEIKESDL